MLRSDSITAPAPPLQRALHRAPVKKRVSSATFSLQHRASACHQRRYTGVKPPINEIGMQPKNIRSSRWPSKLEMKGSPLAVADITEPCAGKDTQVSREALCIASSLHHGSDMTRLHHQHR